MFTEQETVAKLGFSTVFSFLCLVQFVRFAVKNQELNREIHEKHEKNLFKYLLRHYIQGIR